MPRPTTAAELLDRHYLEVRARLLEIAATLDRIDRGPAGDAQTADDPRMQQIREGLGVLLAAGSGEAADRDNGGSAGGRAERIQHLFSRPYQPNWRTSLDV